MNKIDQKIVGYKVVTPEAKEALIAQVNNILDETEGLIVKMPVKKELKRPLVCNSKTYRLKPPQAEHALYVTISSIEEDGKRYPFEIFFNTKNTSHIEWTNALTLTISIAFRTAIETGCSLSGLISNLKETFGASGSYLSKVPSKPKFVNGLVGEIGLVIEEFNNECLAYDARFKYTNILMPETSNEVYEAEEFMQSELGSLVTTFLEEELSRRVTNPCPECGEGMRISEGCLVCPSCAYSKCG